MLRPELLPEVMDPGQLQTRIDALLAAEAERPEIPTQQRLPPGHLESLSRQIAAESHDPHRISRAATPPGPDGPAAPPTVVYLSRVPGVSQFMSVITDCIESELTPSLDRLLHLSSLDELLQDIRVWTEDLRSRFRRFGPCDVRYLEARLASVWADWTGRHAFSTEPCERPLGERARVFILGDWATGLPQARNVAARIREQLVAVPPGLDCHVIHLGDTYYSGLEDECRRRFLDLWPVVGGETCSWTLAGNHDMYSGGYGYFEVLLGDERFTAQRGCSYFALANRHWQILGLDSASKDPDVPDLHDPQGEWLSERMREAGTQRTILLSHHQPFSAFEDVETPLAGAVAEALGEHRVDAWFWGHEHRCAVYRSDIEHRAYRANAKYTALVGHGGVPQLVSDPAQPNPDPAVLEWGFDDCFAVGDDRWSLGGFAVLDFDGPAVEVQYYDEYGKARRDGPPLVHPAGSNSIPDSRPIRPPDRLGDRSLARPLGPGPSG